MLLVRLLANELQVDIKHLASSVVCSSHCLSFRPLLTALPLSLLLFIYSFSLAPSCLTSTLSHFLYLSISPDFYPPVTSCPPPLSILASPLFIFSLFLSSLVCCFLSHWLFLHVFLSITVFRFSRSFFPLFTRPLHTSLHLTYIPFLCPLLSPPSSTAGQTRVDKVEKKPVLTSEGISIYNQSVCVPTDQ